MSIADPKMTIYDLLRTNWNAANTSSVTPAFTTGWYDKATTKPMVTVTTPQESPIRGGETGYIGIDAGGGTPHQLMDGNVNVDCWSHRDASSVNPKQLTFEFTEEVRRIVRANYDGATDLNFISWAGRREIAPDTTKSPTVFRYLCRIGYGYLETS